MPALRLIRAAMIAIAGLIVLVFLSLFFMAVQSYVATAFAEDAPPCTGFAGTKAHMEEVKAPGINILFMELDAADSAGFVAQIRTLTGKPDLMPTAAVVGLARNDVLPSLTGVFIYDAKGCNVGAHVLLTDDVEAILAEARAHRPAHPPDRGA